MEDDEGFEVCEIDDDESDCEPTTEEPKVAYTEAIESIYILIKLYENGNDASQVAKLLNMRANIVKNYQTMVSLITLNRLIKTNLKYLLPFDSIKNIKISM